MKKLSLILSMFLLLVNCSDDDSVSETSNVEFTEIAEGFLGGVGAEGIPKQNIVIYNEADWDELKTKMNTITHETEYFNETEIDFSQYMIIASFTDVKNSGGLSLKAEKVTKNSDNIFVYIKYVKLSDNMERQT